MAKCPFERLNSPRPTPKITYFSHAESSGFRVTVTLAMQQWRSKTDARLKHYRRIANSRIKDVRREFPLLMGHAD